MSLYFPKRVLVEERCRNDGATEEILGRLPGVPVSMIGSVSELDSESGWDSKETLALVHYPGKFMKVCQGSGADTCCGCFIVSCAWNCHFECTYCVLRSYLSHEAMIVCTNLEDLMAEVKGALELSPARIYRIGTGELADSLALDHITSYSRRMVPFFASLPNGVLELKTKSDQIANLEGLDHKGHTVVAWSMNSRRICSTEERNAPGFEERLAAALKCQRWGYKLAFHFDPIIYYESWEEEYKAVVTELFRSADPARIAWVSLGALRFTPHLQEFIRKRFPSSKITYGEFVPGHHGKLRYFRPIREEMYRKMKSWIQAEAPQVFVYLCMESRVVAKAVGSGEWGVGQSNLIGGGFQRILKASDQPTYFVSERHYCIS
jgi:spore photoproduct lyase